MAGRDSKKEGDTSEEVLPSLSSGTRWIAAGPQEDAP